MMTIVVHVDGIFVVGDVTNLARTWTKWFRSKTCESNVGIRGVFTREIGGRGCSGFHSRRSLNNWRISTG